MAENRRNFFISFNNADLAHAEALEAALDEAGFTAFFYPKDLPPGGNIPAWMNDAVMNSDQTLALFSPDYVKDKAVYSFAERYASWWQDARGDKARLIPIHLRDVDFSKYPLMDMLSRIEVQGLPPNESAARIVQRLKAPEESSKRKALQRGTNLPSVFKVGYHSNPNFTGRFEDMDALQKSLQAGNAAVTAVAGMGGVGKTTLAAEYCHRFAGRYGGVWWISAEQESVMLGNIVELGGKLGLTQSGNVETDARTCLDHLSHRPEPWLLVFDNATGPDAIANWLPDGMVRCLITSRFSEFGGIAAVTKLDQWDSETTRDYLLSRTGRDDAEGAANLAKTLEGLPLAAEQAAAFLSTRKTISFDDYARDIVRLIKEPRPAGAKGQYPDTVYAAFVKSLDAVQKMQPLGEIALGILQICSFLSPDGVDLNLLTDAATRTDVFPKEVADVLADKYRCSDALSLLSSLSLLRQESSEWGSVLIFHRLLLAVTAGRATPQERIDWNTVASNLLRAAFPSNSYEDLSRWPQCARLLPHVSPMVNHSLQLESPPKGLDVLISRVAAFLARRGDVTGAISLHEMDVSLSRTPPSSPSELAAALSNLGGSYCDVDRLDEAEAVFKEAIEILEKQDGEKELSLAITNSNLGEVYLKRREFAKAEPLSLRHAEIMKSRYGVTSAEYGKALQNLAAIYGSWARISRLEQHRRKNDEYQAKALEIVIGTLGLRHPSSANVIASASIDRASEGEWAEAIRQIERVVAIYFSLDLAAHQNAARHFGELLSFLDEAGESDKAARLEDGDFSDLLAVVVEIEQEHRAWVAKDPENRHFGPPSPITGARE